MLTYPAGLQLTVKDLIWPQPWHWASIYDVGNCILHHNACNDFVHYRIILTVYIQDTGLCLGGLSVAIFFNDKAFAAKFLNAAWTFVLCFALLQWMAGTFWLLACDFKLFTLPLLCISNLLATTTQQCFFFWMDFTSLFIKYVYT